MKEKERFWQRTWIVIYIGFFVSVVIALLADHLPFFTAVMFAVLATYFIAHLFFGPLDWYLMYKIYKKLRR